MVSSIDASFSAASALYSLSMGMNAVAHNVANVNTDGFQPQRVTYQTGPQGWGVEVGSVEQGSSLLPPLQAASLYPAAPLADGSLPPEVQAPSQTELSREFTTMMAIQDGWEANIASMRTWDVMQGVIIDMKV